MVEKTEVVRARMSTGDVRALSKIARTHETTASDVLRRLVREEAERLRRHEAVTRLGYLAEKVGQALHTLTLHDDPRTTASAFEILSRASVHGPYPFPKDEDGPVRWYDLVRRTLEPNAADQNDPEAKTLGAWVVRAARMTREEKSEFSNALWSLHSFFSRYGRG